MRLVIDTNIVVNALSNGGNSHSKASRLIKDIYAGKHEVYASIEIYREYQEVLARPYLKVHRFARWRWLSWVKRHAVFIEPLPTKPGEFEIGDEDDRVFFDVARCAKARLVTRNLKHFPVDELRTSIDELY